MLILGVRCFRKRIIIGAIARIWETPPLVGNAVTLVEHGNASLTINTVLSERLTEFSEVVRKQWRYKKF